jgi:hypothetical protein
MQARQWEVDVPTYVFSTKDGQTEERFFTMADVPKTIKIGGKIARRNYQAEGRRGGMSSQCWPMVPDMAFGFQADQMEDVRSNDKEHGLSTTQYTKTDDGAFVPVMESPHHYARYCRSQGMFHRNAGYNDAAPNER